MRSLHHLQSKNIKSSGNKGMSPQQASFELRHRVFLALNKLADRDTYQRGMEELEKTIDGLGSEGISPFLSCITETNAEQKSAVRKECVKMMGTLTRIHGSLMVPHLWKMISSITKRLKDQDTVVRDACAETVGLLASHLGDYTLGDSGGAVVVLSKPLFEALGEQNRNVQTGAAMCLARVFDEAREVPFPFLPQMLTRIIKLLKNPHFMAKPALIDLIRSIIQAGGASQTLSLAVNSIQEALKSSEWTTRKAAAVALMDLAENAELLSGALWPLKASSIQSLDCCRFDKVKPVRDVAVQALSSWKSLQGLESVEASETTSLSKENEGRDDYPENGGWKDAFFRKVGRANSKRSPLSINKSCQNAGQSQLYARSDDWRVEISLPKNCPIPLAEPLHEESEDSCVTKSFEEKNHYSLPRKGDNHVYDHLDDDHDNNDREFSATSDLVNMSVQTKDVIEEGKSVNLSRTKDHCSCSSELALIRKQLSDMEHRQTNLMDLIQGFTRNSMDILSDLKSKVNALEITVDKLAQLGQRAMINGSTANSVNSNGQRVERTQARKSMGGISDGRNAVWKRIKEMVRAGDLQAAYEEAIGSGDEVVLMELMDGTGPVLEALSSETSEGILVAMSVFVRDRKYLHLAVPWLRQVAEMDARSESGGVHVTRKAKKLLLGALQDVSAMDSRERSSLEQIYSRLRRAWCEGVPSLRS